MVDLTAADFHILVVVAEGRVQGVARISQCQAARPSLLGVDVLFSLQVGIDVLRVAEIRLRIRYAGLAYQEVVIDKARIIHVIQRGAQRQSILHDWNIDGTARLVAQVVGLV